MSDLDKTQAIQNPDLAKTVRIDPDAPQQGAAPDDPMRKTIVMNRPPEIGAVAWLVADRGANKGTLHQISGDRATIGADSGCEVRLDDGAASDRHASIRFVEDHFSITDLDSTNGTKVNGETVLKQDLADGDRISIGSADWVFKCVVFESE